MDDLETLLIQFDIGFVRDSQLIILNGDSEHELDHVAEPASTYHAEMTELTFTNFFSLKLILWFACNLCW